MLSKFVTCLCFGLGPNIMLLWWAKRDFCMQAAQTTFFIIFKISPAYASWHVTLLLVLFCHVQSSLSCSLHCCNYIFALVMCTYRNISGWSDINTKICEQCGMAITEWFGLELECADVLEHQLEVARQHVHDCQRIINKLRLDMQVLDAGVKKWNKTQR